MRSFVAHNGAESGVAARGRDALDCRIPYDRTSHITHERKYRMPLAIEDYALIGDGHTAALVGRDGSIDWLCWPRFDSGACFAALLGTRDHGRWLIAPSEEAPRISRRYRPDTLILETLFETSAGAVRLMDFMPIRRRQQTLMR